MSDPKKPPAPATPGRELAPPTGWALYPRYRIVTDARTGYAVQIETEGREPMTQISEHRQMPGRGKEKCSGFFDEPPREPSTEIRVECEMPTKTDLDWMESAVQRHTGGFEAWWTENRDHVSGRQWMQIFIGVWEGGRGGKKHG